MKSTPVGRIVIRPSDDTKAIIGITKGADHSLQPGMVYEIRKDERGVMTLHEVGESCIRGPIKDEDTRQDAVFSWAHDLGLIFDAMGVQCVATLAEPRHIENIQGILEEQQHYRFMNMRQLGYAGSPVLEFFFPRFDAPRSRPKEVEQQLTEMFAILEADPDAALKMVDAIKEKYANIPELSKAEVMIWKRRALAADDRHDASTTEPTKGDTAPMSQPITEQDIADYLTKFIQTSELVPDQMKALFIGRVTNWGNPVGAQPVETTAPSASVARMPDDASPLNMTITKDDDGCFFIAIGDRKWKIMRHGIIGNGKADREEFHQAASDLVDNALPVSDAGPERVVLWSELEELFDSSRFYKISMRYRKSLEMTLGQVAYEAFVSTSPSSEHQAWELLGGIEKGRWEVAGQAAYLSIGLDPSEINRELQVLAARKRMLLLRSVYCGTTGIGNVASDIALIAGPTPQPKP